MAKRAWISKRTRFEIFKRDGFRCRYCGVTPAVSLLRVDHVIAVSAGGTNDRSNLVTACEPCNAGKSSLPLDEYARYLDERFARIDRVRVANRAALIFAARNQLSDLDVRFFFAMATVAIDGAFHVSSRPLGGAFDMWSVIDLALPKYASTAAAQEAFFGCLHRLHDLDMIRVNWHVIEGESPSESYRLLSIHMPADACGSVVARCDPPPEDGEWLLLPPTLDPISENE